MISKTDKSPLLYNKIEYSKVLKLVSSEIQIINTLLRRTGLTEKSKNDLQDKKIELKAQRVNLKSLYTEAQVHFVTNQLSITLKDLDKKEVIDKMMDFKSLLKSIPRDILRMPTITEEKKGYKI